MRKILFALLVVILILPVVFALRNPAAVYCQSLDYDYVIKKSPEGEAGFCKLPDGQEVDEWQFLLGEVGQEFGYCAKQGYETKITKDPQKCLWFLTDSCAVCVVDGREVEVTDSETGEKIEFKAGDLVQFEKGLNCVWNVKKPVRKHYNFSLDFGEID